jgi:hypothetical protein
MQNIIKSQKNKKNTFAYTCFLVKKGEICSPIGNKNRAKYSLTRDFVANKRIKNAK